MPGSATIGKVAVKVIPDTTGFRKQLERELKALERDLDKAVKVKVELDQNGLREKAKQLRDDMQKDLKKITLQVDLGDQDDLRKGIAAIDNELKKLRQVKIEVDLDEDSLLAERERLEAILNDVASIELRVKDGNSDSIRRAISDLNGELDKLNDRRIEVKLDQDSLLDARNDLVRNLDDAYDQIRARVREGMRDLNLQVRADIDPRDVDRALRDIERDLEKIEKLKIRLKTELDKESRANTEREILDLQDSITKKRAKLEVELEVDKDGKANAALTLLGSKIAALSGLRLAGNYASTLVQKLGSIDKLAPKVAVVGLAAGGLASALLASVSNLSALVVGVGQLAPLALAAPGIVAGIGIGLGSLIAVLKDFGDVFPDVEGKLSALQDRMSAKFWKEAEKPLREFIDTLLPEFGKGLEDVSQKLGLFIGDLADAFKGELAGSLDGMFDNLAESIEIARDAAKPLAQIVRTLGEVGAEYLPRLAQWFVDLTTRFAEFVTSAQEDGRLKAWIDGGIEAAKALGEIIGSLVGIIRGVGEAALLAGGSSLSMFADTLDRINTAINSELGQSILVSVFTAAHEALELLYTNSGPGVLTFFQGLNSSLGTLLPIIGGTLGTLLGFIGQILGKVLESGAVTEFFASIQGLVAQMEPLVQPLTDKLNALFGLFTTFVDVVGPPLIEALGYVFTAFDDLAPTIEFLIKTLGTGLAAAIGIVGPLITGLTGFLNENQTAANVLATIITTVVIGAYVKMAARATATAVITGAQWVLKTAQATVAAATITAKIGLIIAQYTAMGVKAVVTAAIVGAQWTAKAAVAGAKAILIGAAYVLAFVTKGAIAVAAVVANTAIIVGKWVLKATTATAQAAKIGAAYVLAFVTKGAVAVAAIVANTAIIVAKWVFMGTQALINGAKVAAAWLLALGPIGLVIAAVIAAVVVVVANWERIKEAFLTGVEKVVSFVKGLPDEIVAIFGGAGGLLIAAGGKIIDGLIQGIKGAFGKVRDTLSSLTSMLPDWKGPAERDAVILKDAGKLVIGGFIDGMESQYGQVRKSLSSLTDEVEGTVIGAPQIGPMRNRMLAQVAAASAGSDGQTKTFNYYAAPGSSLGSEEDLFASMSRARMVGW